MVTLRRTGATALMYYLSTVSSFPRLMHEPFNYDRIFGNITAAYEVSKDIAATKSSMRDALRNRPNIKHCIDTVPFAVSDALLAVCRDYDYAFLAWTRKDAKARLLSLFLAQQTGKWDVKGRQQLLKAISNKELSLAPFNLAQLAEQARSDTALWEQMLTRLGELSISFKLSTFEDMYGGTGLSCEKAAEFAARFGIRLGVDDPRVKDFVQAKPASPSNILNAVPNIEEARALLSEIMGP